MANIKVSRICNEDCLFTCHKATCERGSWAKAAFPTATLPKVGIDTECPLMQFNARQSENYKSCTLSESGTWKLCAECEYSDITEDGTVSLEKCYEAHCLDCPVNMMRESLQEISAESSCS